jgi:hypothetical protein
VIAYLQQHVSVEMEISIFPKVTSAKTGFQSE